MHADFYQGHALIFVEENVCFALSISFSDSEASQLLHSLPLKSFNIIY
jgi:hypothetical protein